MRRKLAAIASGVMLTVVLVSGAGAAPPANPGCVGASVSAAAQAGYRSQEVATWRQNAKNSGVAPGQLGVEWIQSHCGLPARQ